MKASQHIKPRRASRSSTESARQSTGQTIGASPQESHGESPASTAAELIPGLPLKQKSLRPEGSSTAQRPSNRPRTSLPQAQHAASAAAEETDLSDDDDWDMASNAPSACSFLSPKETEHAKEATDLAAPYELVTHEEEAFEIIAGHADSAGHPSSLASDKTFNALLAEIESQYQKFSSAKAVSRAPRSIASIVVNNTTPGQALAAGLSAVHLALNPIGTLVSATRAAAINPHLLDAPYYRVAGALKQATDPQPRAQLLEFIDAFNTPERKALFDSRPKAEAALLKGYQDELLGCGRWAKGEQKDWKEAMTILTKQAEVLSFPETVQPLAPDFDMASLTLAFGREKEGQMLTELTRMSKNADPNIPDDECARAQFWIHGEKGVGKSWFATKELVNTGLPIIKIKSEKESVEDMFQAPSSASTWDDPMSGDKHLGILLHAMVKAGCKNPIIVMDEFDDFFTTHATRLKDFTNRDNRTLKGPGDTEGVFSRCTIIVIGNQPPADLALAERFTIIEKQYVPRADKERIAQKFASDLTDKLKRRDPEAGQWIEEKLNSLLPLIVDENEIRRIGGVRTMCDTIKATFEQLEVGWRDGKGDDNIEPMRQFIRERFDGQAGRPIVMVSDDETRSTSTQDSPPRSAVVRVDSSSSVSSAPFRRHPLLSARMPSASSALSAPAVATTTDATVAPRTGSGPSAEQELARKLG